ncbi:hypothetical protein Pyn_34554 [Prunus yedoensis var. nudiflora]|uniref:Uncharacterized protein n=1 Tax=Prunus yedoensis var. nudiflora TaxID=2094558 RepID=A0A314YY16_PRUYE|nr:hypothetical protein Pyn_34554 [Prunus yedoensis var. nudiflora]
MDDMIEREVKLVRERCGSDWLVRLGVIGLGAWLENLKQVAVAVGSVLKALQNLSSRRKQREENDESVGTKKRGKKKQKKKREVKERWE